jgi:hypothetical protein
LTGEWKLGTGASYAALTGFTWPANTGAATYERLVTKLKMVRPIPYTDNPLIIDQGTQSIQVNVEGVFWSETDIKGLAAQAAKTKVGTDGKAQNLMQRLYVSATEYILVRNGIYRENRFATNPLGYPYILTFDAADPFVYTEGLTTYSSASGASPRTATGIANSGTAYCFPIFSIVNGTGTAITTLTITYGSVSLTWTGTLASGATLDIYQDVLESNGLYGLHAYVGTTETGICGGNRIILAESVTGASMSCTFTGGSGGATFSVKVPNRRW